MSTIHTRPEYLRVSLLSSCNMRCSYCIPSDQHPSTISAPVASVRSAIRFLQNSGIRKIRFTGGEPTLYKDLSGLITFIKSMNNNVHAAVTTNGVLLESLASELADAGLDSLNISLDTLDRNKFRYLTGRDYLHDVIDGIDAAADCIGNVKLNSVLMRGVNDEEVSDLIKFADQRNLDIRFIEFMPNLYSTPDDSRFISSEEMRMRLPWNFRMIPALPNNAARYFTSSSLNVKVGFISSVSHPFCTGCNRIRLAADGHLYTCLYDSNSINLFDLLTEDPNNAETEFEKLVRSKQYSGCNIDADSSSLLPSFSTIGG